MRGPIKVALLCILVCITTQEVLISQSFVGNNFDGPDGWSVHNAPVGFNVCSGVKIFGGDGKFGQWATIIKAFELPPHHSVRLKVQFWKIDSWDNEEFLIYIDDNIVHRQKFHYSQGKPLCGRGHSQWNELVLDMNLAFKHSAPTAVVGFSSTLDQGADDESWGIRDFQFFAYKCPDGCDACVQGETQEQCSVWKAVKAYWTGLKKENISAEGWTVIGGNAQPYVCGGVPVLGGYGNMGKGTIVKHTVPLPPHYKIKVKLVVLKIDSWDNEFAQFKIDGKEVWIRRYQYHEGFFGQICGSGNQAWKDWFSPIEIVAQHTGDQVMFELTNNLDSATTDESIAYRDFYIFIAQCAKNCGECTGPKPADCKKCEHDWALQDGECKPLANFILLEQSFLENKFAGVNDWTLSANKGGKVISECAGKSLIGGFDIFGDKGVAQKQFALPHHKRLRLMATIYKIDSWDNEWMIIKVDGVEIWKQQWNLQTGGGNLCGQGVWNDHIETVDAIFVHNSNKALVQFTSTLNQDANDESWGFRDFKLFYEAKEECAIFYTECDFKGASFEFCTKSPDFKKDSIPAQIRSIKVPPQGKVTLFDSADYNGKKIVYTEDQVCIKAFNFSVLQVQGGQQWKELKME